jgi:hypothetical protein
MPHKSIILEASTSGTSPGLLKRTCLRVDLIHDSDALNSSRLAFQEASESGVRPRRICKKKKKSTWAKEVKVAGSFSHLLNVLKLASQIGQQEIQDFRTCMGKLRVVRITCEQMRKGFCQLLAFASLMAMYRQGTE